MFGYISLAHAAELLSTPLGHSLITLMAIFWFARALEQLVFFRLRHWGSWAFLIIFLVGSAMYAYAAMYST
jgi:hypothetical protein